MSKTCSTKHIPESGLSKKSRGLITLFVVSERHVRGLSPREFLDFDRRVVVLCEEVSQFFRGGVLWHISNLKLEYL